METKKIQNKQTSSLIEKSRKLQEFSLKAISLYNKCKEVADIDPSDPPTPSPIDFLKDQFNFLSSWRENELNTSTMNPILRSILENNEFHTYMKYMCDTFPEDYGKILLLNNKIDMWDKEAELFFSMKD